jgi:hypothetical protein
MSRFAGLLAPVDLDGPIRAIYSYIHLVDGDIVGNFLRNLRQTDHGRYSHYHSAFKRMACFGYAPGEKHHMLDRERVPRGIALDARGNPLSLEGIGEFKNNGHKSRILHCTDGRAIILLTVFTGKKENKLPTEAINPALKAREEYLRRKRELTNW